MSEQSGYEFIRRDRCPACKSQDHQNFWGRRASQRGGLFPWRQASMDLPVFRCGKCALTYSNPLPIPLSMSQHYGMDPENYWPEQYFQLDPNFSPFSAVDFQKIERLIPGIQKPVYLDVGSGIGKSMRALAAKGWDVWGIEPGEQFHKAAITKGQIPSERLRNCSIENAEFPENFFDMISFGAVVEHLADPFACLNRSLDWLKPGGIIHIEVPSSNWLIGKAYRLVQKCMGSQYVTNLSPMHVPYHLHEFTHKSFELLPFANRFSIADYQYWPCLTYLPRGLSWLATKYMKYTDTGMQLVIYLRKT